ncbi:MAG: YHS domain-containing protein [Anaerolineaceae bacterium]|nr:YHS domain-containing protein [Anaerolineaceae bacterium]
MAETACGSPVDPETAEYVTEYNGVTYYFCMDSCKTLFDQEPARYTGPAHGEVVGDRQPHCCPHCCDHT